MTFDKSFASNGGPVAPIPVAPFAQQASTNNSSFARGFPGPNAPFPIFSRRIPRTSAIPLIVDDRGNFFDITSGTFTQPFPAPSEAKDGWYVFLRNSGTGDITIPSSDGVTNWIMYQGESRWFGTDGVNYFTYIISPFYRSWTASGTFTKPPGYTQFGYNTWHGGASGGAGEKSTGGDGQGGSGGGGGAMVTGIVAASLLAASEVVTVGAGGIAVAGRTTNGAGVNGNNGGVSSIGSVISIGIGGLAGTGGNGPAAGGIGGRAFSTSNSITATGSFSGGTTAVATPSLGSVFGGGGGGSVDTGYVTRTPGCSQYGGSGGGAGGSNNSDCDGGAGASSTSTTGGGTGGTTGAASTVGGVGTAAGSGGGGGGASTTASQPGRTGGVGTAPGGGGGGGGAQSNADATTSGAGGAGARGQVDIWGVA